MLQAASLLPVDTSVVNGRPFHHRLASAPYPAAVQDYREIRIQEPVTSLAMGAMPRSLPIVLEDDLVDCVRAGASGRLRVEVDACSR